MNGARLLFNFVTLSFVILTLAVVVGVAAIAADSMDAPFWAVSDTEEPLPTLLPTNTPITGIPTLTPSFTPPAQATEAVDAATATPVDQ